MKTKHLEISNPYHHKAQEKKKKKGYRRDAASQKGNKQSLCTQPQSISSNDLIAIEVPRSAVLQIIARNKTRSAALAHNLSLPPAVVLQAQDREDIAFAER